VDVTCAFMLVARSVNPMDVIFIENLCHAHLLAPIRTTRTSESVESFGDND
jgi:hypothetical protein